MQCKNCGADMSFFKRVCEDCGAEREADTPAENQNRSIKLKWIIYGIIIIASIYGGISDFLDKDAIDINNSTLSEQYNQESEESAISGFQEALNEAHSNEAKLLTSVNLGYAYAADSQFDMAQKTFKEALQYTKSNSSDEQLILGEIALYQNNPTEAEKYYLKANELLPNDYQILSSLATFYLNTENFSKDFFDPEKSIVYAKNAYNVVKNNQDENIIKSTVETLAIGYYLESQYEETIKVLSESNHTNDPENAYIVGMSYLLNGQSEIGQPYLETAVRQGDMTNEELDEYLNILKDK